MLKQLSYYDPAVAFLEIGVEVEGETAWKVYGLDLDKTYGGLQGIGGLRAIIQDGNVIRIIDDVQGNVLGYVDTDNKITWNSVRDYDAYGPLGELESGGCGKSLEKLLDSNSLSIALFKAHVWRGKRQEANGLIYFGKRYYDPTTGRFISPDPLGHSGSIDLYSYANGDPVNFVDPSGMFACAAMEGVNSFAGKILPYMPFYQSSRDLAAATTGIDPETGKPFSDLGRFFAGANSFFGGVLDAVSLGKGTAAAKLASSGIATMGRFVGNGMRGVIAKNVPIGNTLKQSSLHVSKFQQLEFGFVQNLISTKPLVYPPNNGFLGGGSLATLIPGTQIDRYGKDIGRFASPLGTSFLERSLPSSSASLPYSVFEVLKPVEVKAGVAAPWFDMPGMGMQYQFEKSIQNLIENGYLKPIYRNIP